MTKFVTIPEKETPYYIDNTIVIPSNRMIIAGDDAVIVVKFAEYVKYGDDMKIVPLKFYNTCRAFADVKLF